MLPAYLRLFGGDICLWLEPDSQILDSLGSGLINVNEESEVCASENASTFGVHRGKVDIVAVYLKSLLALAVVDTVHSHANDTVARPL